MFINNSRYLNQVFCLNELHQVCVLAHRFSTGGTRTPRGTLAVAKRYAKTTIIEKYVAENK